MEGQMPFLFYPKNEQVFGAQAPGARPQTLPKIFLIIFQKPIDKYAFLCYNNSTKEREERTNENFICYSCNRLRNYRMWLL